MRAWPEGAIFQFQTSFHSMTKGVLLGQPIRILKVILIGFVFHGLLACKAPNLADLVPVDKVDADALKSAANSLCATGEILVPRTVSSDEKLSNYPREIVAFGFFKGTSGCALTADFHQDGIFDEWYSITLQDNCLANGSVWKVKTVSFPSHTVNLELSQIQRTPEYVVKIKSGEMVSLKDLADASGMITYRCEPAPNEQTREFITFDRLKSVGSTI
jgi:hypothetical protein